jgi:hypothetical protein
MSIAAVGALNATAICVDYNFTDVKSLQFFINATWYNNITSAQNATNMSDTELNSFYDPLLNNSFQYTLND